MQGQLTLLLYLINFAAWAEALFPGSSGEPGDLRAANSDIEVSQIDNILSL